MERAFSFKKEKLLSLPEPQQHKKCCELLRAAYELLLEAGDCSELVQTYGTWCSWIDTPPLLESTAEAISDRYHHHRQQANVELKEHNLLPRVTTRDTSKPAAAPLPVSVYLDNLRSGHNVGSILRTAEAFGLENVSLSANTPTPSNKKVADAAMGAEEWITTTTDTAISDLPRPIIAIETCEDGEPLAGYPFPAGPFTVALGNEEYGCSNALLQSADAVISIPLFGKKNSLNVANAFAVVAAEICRQRR